MGKRATVTQKMWSDAVKEFQLIASIFEKHDRYIGAGLVDEEGEDEESVNHSRLYSELQFRYRAAEQRVHDLRREMKIDFCCGRRKKPVPPFPTYRVRYSKKFPLKDFKVLEQAQRELYSPCFRRVNTKGVTVQ